MSYGNLHSSVSSEYLTFISSLQIWVNDSVGQPYQIARAGMVNEPSMTSPKRQTNRPRLSPLCIRAYIGVVPRGRSGSAGLSMVGDTVLMWSSLVGEDLAVAAVQVRDCQERRD